MSNESPPSPNELDTLKELLTEQRSNNEKLQAGKDTLTKKNKQLQTDNEQLQEHVLSLQEQLNLALARRYAASSEKIDVDQLRLFDEVEAETDDDEHNRNDDDSITIESHTRQKNVAAPRYQNVYRVLRCTTNSMLPCGSANTMDRY